MWTAADQDHAEELVAFLAMEEGTEVPDDERSRQIADLDERIRLLRAASRPTEPLTAGAAPTAQGHILSALSQLERRRAELQRH